MNHELIWVLCLFMLMFFMRLVGLSDSNANTTPAASTDTITTKLSPDHLFKKNKSKVEQNIINSSNKGAYVINLEERRAIIKLREEVHEGTHRLT